MFFCFLYVGLPEPSAAEAGGPLARGNNNAEQVVRDHRRSAEDSFVYHHYWSLSVVTGERKEEDFTFRVTRADRWGTTDNFCNQLSPSFPVLQQPSESW